MAEILEGDVCKMLTNRLREVKIDRPSELPGGSTFRYRTVAALTTEAKLGPAEFRPGVAMLNAVLRVSLKFEDDSPPGPAPTTMFCEINASVEGVFETDIALERIQADAEIGPLTLKRATNALLISADNHIRQLLGMGQLPFSVPLEKLFDIAEGQQTVR